MPTNVVRRTLIWIAIALCGCSFAAGQTAPAKTQAVQAKTQPAPLKAQAPPAVPPEVQKEIDALGSKDTNERISAADKLGAMGPAAAPAIPHLIPLLRYHGLESIKVGDQLIAAFDLSASAAAAALARIGKPAFEPLRKRLSDPNAPEDAPYWAAVALARMNDPAATRLLLATLKDPASPAREAVARALAHSADPQALNALLGLAKDSDPKMRAAAIAGLESTKDPRAVDAMAAALHDGDPKVRRAAAGSLLHQPDPRAFDDLVRALKDSEDLVRNLCAQALGAIKDKRAIEPLLELVTKDSDNLVRFQAGRALEALTGQKFGEDGARWQKWWQEQKVKQP